MNVIIIGPLIKSEQRPVSTEIDKSMSLAAKEYNNRYKHGQFDGLR